MSDEQQPPKQLFLLKKFTGLATGGFIVKNDLKEFFEVLEKSGRKPVGIIYNGTYNLEVLVSYTGEKLESQPPTGAELIVE